MDSISQIVLGGALAAAVAPAAHRRAALLAGAALGTLPDLDNIPLGLLVDDAVLRMVWHRSITHSLFVLPLAATLIWWLYKRYGRGRVAEAPTRWFWAIQLALVTHPLLDAFTVYGTQLWWPLSPPPAMWSSVFIIDPLYTVWLIVACAMAWRLREAPRAQTALVAALAISSAYLGWSLIAKAQVDAIAQRSLAARGLGDAPRFSVPMPFNTLLWRVVAMTPDGYLEGEYSLVADDGPIRFRSHASDTAALAEAAQLPNIQRLQWFNRGFMKAQQRDGQLILSDLRMGVEPDYIFNFAVARRDGVQWRAITAQQLDLPWNAGGRLAGVWDRIWTPASALPSAPAPADRDVRSAVP